MRFVPSSPLGIASLAVCALVLLVGVLGIGNPWRAGYAEIPTLKGAWTSIATPTAGGIEGTDWLIQCPGGETDTCLRRAGYICDAFEVVQSAEPVAPVRFSRGWSRGGTTFHLTDHIFITCSTAS